MLMLIFKYADNDYQLFEAADMKACLHFYTLIKGASRILFIWDDIYHMILYKSAGYDEFFSLLERQYRINPT